MGRSQDRSWAPEPWPLGQTREGGEGRDPRSQETCRRSSRPPGGVPLRRLVLRSARIGAALHPVCCGFRVGLPRARRQGINRVTLPEDTKDTAVPDGPTVYVCVTCRKPDDDADGPRAGLLLAEAAAKAARGTDVTVRHVECLANCRRSLSAAMRKKDSWTYIFGDLSAPDDAAALIDGAAMLAEARGRSPALAGPARRPEGRPRRARSTPRTRPHSGGL
jgi:predicted metal-binding protein